MIKEPVPPGYKEIYVWEKVKAGDLFMSEGQIHKVGPTRGADVANSIDGRSAFNFFRPIPTEIEVPEHRKLEI